MVKCQKVSKYYVHDCTSGENFGNIRSTFRHFVDAESERKTLKNFNLAILNAILMKLTTIMYLHDSMDRKALRARNSDFWLNFLKSLDYIENRHAMSCITLHCITSKVFGQIRPHLEEYSMKNHPNKIGSK